MCGKERLLLQLLARAEHHSLGWVAEQYVWRQTHLRKATTAFFSLWQKLVKEMLEMCSPSEALPWFCSAQGVLLVQQPQVMPRIPGVHVALHFPPFLSPRDQKLPCMRKCGRTWSQLSPPCSPKPQRMGWRGYANRRGSSPSCWSRRWTSTSSSASPATPWKSAGTWIPRAMV